MAFYLEVLIQAIDSIKKNKLRSFLTTLGMMIGVSAVIILVSIGNGAKLYISNEFESLGTNLVLIQPGKTDAKSSMGPPISSSKGKLTLSDVEAIQKQAPSIRYVSGIMFGTAAVKSQKGTSNINLLSGNEQLNKIFNIQLAYGQFISKDDDQTARRVIVLGSNVAKNLFPQTIPLGQLVKVNQSEHRVIGVISPTGDKLGLNIDNMAFTPTKAGMRTFNSINLFGIRASAISKGRMNDSVNEITEILKSRNDGEDNFTIITQLSMLETMNTILNMLSYALVGIACISMLVGGIGIMNIMLVNVTERTREIGIRRAVGARRKDIMFQFLVEAVQISFLGGFLGVAVAVIFTYTITFIFPSFDMRPPFWIYLPSFSLSVLVGIVFGVLPARRAAFIETIDALRYE